MGKVTDLKAYWTELAKKNGIDDDTLKPVLEAMEKESFKKAMTEGFKPLPDYSSDLDSVRDRTRAEKDAEYHDWHEDEKKKYQEYVRGMDLVAQYEAKFGKLDGNVNGTNGAPPMLTEDQINKLLEAKLSNVLSSRDGAYMDLLEIREQHMSTFKTPLDTKSFEEAWKTHPEWGQSMRQAYKSYVEPEVAKIREAEWDTKLKAKYDEGLRDGYSRRSIPMDNGAKIFSPMFDRKEDVAKMSDRQQDDHSKNAFLDGLRDSMKQPV